MEGERNSGLSINPYGKVFTDASESLDFMLKHGILKPRGNCSSCGGILTIVDDLNSIDGVSLKCVNYKCRNKRSIKYGSKFEHIKVSCDKIMRTIYCFIYDYANFQAINFIGVSEPTYIKMKNIIIDSIDFDDMKIGEKDTEVQIDETAICNGLIITNPSNTLDEKANVQWILGGVESKDIRNCFLKLVTNRKIDALYDAFKEHIHKESILVTDGYPSYSSALKRFGSQHIVVNHSEGFVNAEGYSTNMIENLWSHLKKDYRERAGVYKNRIGLFLKEFQWKKKHLKSKRPDDMVDAFYQMVNILRCE